MNRGWRRVRAATRVLGWCLVFGLQLAASVVVCFTARTLVVSHRGEAALGDIRIDGAQAVHPRLEFACELATEQLQSLFSKPDVIDDLRQLNAALSLSLIDLSPGRAGVVRRLNEAGIPVTAWLALPKEQGYYLNAANAGEAAARFAAFETWTRDYGLRWARVGLDIEPGLQEFGAVSQGHWLRPAAAVARRYFDTGSVKRARNAYAALIGRIQSDGYRVETYQFPFIADERKANSTMLERFFGIVDVRGDREVLMTYTSFNHAIDSALIWQYGPEAQIVAVGSTAGDAEPGGKFGPLSWDEFTHDVVVASRFSPAVGVYSLEGCVRQGFLPRLKTMNWGQSFTIPAEANRKVIQLRTRIQSALWTGSHLPYLAAAVLLLDILLIWRRYTWNRSPTRPTA
jgi:hypothetical protein